MNLWHVNEDTFSANLKQLRSQESVFTIGNGYFCTRGTFEEGYPRDTPATLLFGVFDDVPIAKEELANAPDWTSIDLLVNGEHFRLDTGKIIDYQRTLDLYNGVLKRTVRWESPTGIRLHITSERFASLADEHLGAIRYSVTYEGGSNEIEVVLHGNFNLAVGNYDVMHWETVGQGHNQDILWFRTETKHSGVELVQSMSFTTRDQGYRREFVDSYISPSIRLYGKLAPGATLTTEKIVVMYTSRDGIEPQQAALEHHHQILALEAATSAPQVYETLLSKHQQAWQQFWQTADVIIEGDAKAQIGTRYNIYQLRISASLTDSRYSIAAKGLTGFGYRGHVFHDTEIFMLPFFTYVMPEVARNLLIYRHRLLPAAREKAASNGYRGAQYPWESTLDGEEATPPSMIHPETGQVIAILNGTLELHLIASIAHAVMEYWQVTGDDAFMTDYGAEIILSTAMFWVSRAEHHPERDDYEITNVVGPDEWHEHVNNNAYTNYMARWNILKALETLKWLRENRESKARELEQALDLSSGELAHWQEVAQKMRVLYNKETRLFEQFDGFFQLEPLDQTKYAEGRRKSYQALLGMDGVQKYQIIKQADVLMLLTVLREEFDRRTKQVNWDYYYPITDHDYGSSLTPALHAILACELGRVEDAYKMFMKGALIDLENLRGNTPEGIHNACSGAVWQAIAFGFAGLSLSDNSHTTHPVWPDGWTRLALTIKHKGQSVAIDLHR